MRLSVVATLALSAFCLAVPLHATDYLWTRSGNSDLWSDATNWNPAGAPDQGDNILLTQDSPTGAQNIDLSGARRINTISTSGLSGVYTFINSTAGGLEFFGAAGSSLITNSSPNATLVFNHDLALISAGETFFSAAPNSGRITVNGNITSTALSGISTLNLTSGNSALPDSIAALGTISDGPAAQMAVTIGSSANAGANRGQVRLSGLNSYSGPTTINAATLTFNSIADFGPSAAASALGAPTTEANATISVGTKSGATNYSGTLRYAGTVAGGHSSNRPIYFPDGSSGGIIEASGAGPLILSGGLTSAASDTLSRTLVLSGSSTGNNTFSGTIEDVSGAAGLNVIKTGSGKWILTGTNTFDGELLINGGELVIAGPSASIIPNHLSMGGGSLTIDGGTVSPYFVDGNNVNFRSGTFNFTRGGISSTYTGNLSVGSNGPGTLNIGPSYSLGITGTLTLHDSDDTLNLSDNTSSLSVGTLDNSAGGSVNLAGVIGVVDQVILPSGTIGGGLGGPGGLTKVGPGVLTYAGVSLNIGPMRVQGGKVVIAPAVALNDAIAVTVDAGATLEYTAGTADTIFSLNSAGTVLMNRDLSIGGATMPASNGGSGSISGSLQGSGRLQKRGPGTLTISGSATHTGPTLIENGNVILTGSLSGTSSISITDGPLTGGGTLTINGGQVSTPGVLSSQTAASTLILNGGSITAGQLNFSSFENGPYLSTFTWTAGTIHITNSDIELSSGNSRPDKPFRSTLTLDPSRALIVDNSLVVGTGGTLNLSGGRLAVGSSFGTALGVFNFNSGTLEFLHNAFMDANFVGNTHSSPLTAGKTLKVDGSAFLMFAFELDGGVLSVKDVSNAYLLRLQAGTLNVTNTLPIDSNKILDVARGVIVNAGRLSVGSNGQLNAIGATITTTAASSNLGQINSIGSTITLVGGLSGSGQLNLINTILNNSAPIEAGAITSSGATHSRSISSGNVSVNSGTLTLDLNSGPSVFDALSISSGSSLNLTNNTLIIRTGRLKDINALIRSGLNSSTGLLANLTAPNQRLGAMVNGGSGLPLYSTFDGINLTGGEILIRKTIDGDLNLDGQVSIADFIELASNFGSTAATWENGDVNYDQQVTIADFIELASNFNTTFAGEALAAGDFKGAVLADFYAGHVPEPGALASAMAGLLLCRRRWTRARG